MGATPPRDCHTVGPLSADRCRAAETEQGQPSTDADVSGRHATSVACPSERRRHVVRLARMSFGKNPFEQKALAAEQKAADAPDAIARTAAYREAAHLWDRAAAREKPGKRRSECEANAERNRALADEPTEPAAAPSPPSSTRPKAGDLN